MPSAPGAGVYSVSQTNLPVAGRQVIAPYPPADPVVKPTLPEGEAPWPGPRELLTVAVQTEPASTI
ncbi:MAG TPA: hypothetical protein VIW22_06515 [Nitrososphaerales archaeon]